MPFTLLQIDDYIQALTRNAEALIHEASILFQHQAFARAFTLSHLAREELSKCLMLQSAGIKTLAGHPIDEKKLLKRLRDHKAKLTTEHVQNSVMVAALGGLEDARKMLMNGGALSDKRNDRKNDSLYVGYKDGVISQPSEQFTEQQAARNIALATGALAQQKNIICLMGRLSERAPIVMPRIEPGDIKIEDMQIILEEMALSMKKFYEGLN